MSMTSPDDMMAAITTTLKDRTGRTLDEWVAEVERSGLDPMNQKAVRAWLKETPGDVSTDVESLMLAAYQQNG